MVYYQMMGHSRREAGNVYQGIKQYVNIILLLSHAETVCAVMTLLAELYHLKHSLVTRFLLSQHVFLGALEMQHFICCLEYRYFSLLHVMLVSKPQFVLHCIHCRTCPMVFLYHYFLVCVERTVLSYIQSTRPGFLSICLPAEVSDRIGCPGG